MRTKTPSRSPSSIGGALSTPARAWKSAWPPDRQIALLAAGDALSFLLFAIIGRRSHQEAAGLDTLAQIAWTALPFALGWFLVAPFLGAFRRAEPRGKAVRKRTIREVDARALLATLGQTELAWLAAWPVTLLLRWALSSDHNVPLSFALVILIANAVLLGSWRTGFALARQLLVGRTDK